MVPAFCGIQGTAKPPASHHELFSIVITRPGDKKNHKKNRNTAQTQ